MLDQATALIGGAMIFIFLYGFIQLGITTRSKLEDVSIISSDDSE